MRLVVLWRIRDDDARGTAGVGEGGCIGAQDECLFRSQAFLEFGNRAELKESDPVVLRGNVAHLNCWHELHLLHIRQGQRELLVPPQPGIEEVLPSGSWLSTKSRDVGDHCTAPATDRRIRLTPSSSLRPRCLPLSPLPERMEQRELSHGSKPVRALLPAREASIDALVITSTPVR